MPATKAIIYCRVSSDDGRQTTDNQLLILRDLAQRNDMQIIEEYLDNAQGDNKNRPEFIRMMGDIQKHKGKGQLTLLFYRLDRFTREGALATLEYLRDIGQAGVDWKSAMEPYLDSAALGIFKDVVITILATLAAQEKVVLKERTIAGLQRAKIHGTRSGKAIGRPVHSFDQALATELLKTMSEAAAAKQMGIPAATFRLKIHGRKEKKQKPVWSEPMHGRIGDGEILFVEDEGGDVVIRYDRVTGKPHCMNHKGLLERCRGRHEERMEVGA